MRTNKPKPPQSTLSTTFSGQVVEYTAPNAARSGRGDTPPIDSPSQQVRRPSAVIRLLSRIDRKLCLLLRQQDKQPGDLLTIAQAATVAGVSPTTIRRAIKLTVGPDKLVAYDQSLGRNRASWRIDPTDLDAWRKRREGRQFTPLPRTVRVPVSKAGQFKF